MVGVGTVGSALPASAKAAVGAGTVGSALPTSAKAAVGAGTVGSALPTSAKTAVSVQCAAVVTAVAAVSPPSPLLLPLALACRRSSVFPA